MSKLLKLKCDCGGVFEERTIKENEFQYKVLACSKCGEEMFTREQTKKYAGLLKMQEELNNAEDMVIRKAGNSKGVTLPAFLSKYGFVEGKKFNWKVKDEQSLVLQLTKG